MPVPSPRERQRALAALGTLSQRELRTIWRKLDLRHPNGLAEPLAQVLTEIADKYGTAAASLAADWYDEARADAGAAGKFTATPAALPDADRFEALSGWGIGPLFGADPDDQAALSLLAGGLERIVQNAARHTTAKAVREDHRSGARYARIASADACAFCVMLASRGAVYHSRKSAGDLNPEDYHDYCNCAVVEQFPGRQIDLPDYVKFWRKEYANAAVLNEHGAVDLTATLSKMREALGTN